jgi:multicomponent Na+:H+ antiporter subunit D
MLCIPWSSMTALYIAAGAASRIGKSFDLMDRLGGLYTRSCAVLAALSLVLFCRRLGPAAVFRLLAEGRWLATGFSGGRCLVAGRRKVLLTGFLTTIAVGRVWALAYWRPVGSGEDQTSIKLSTGGIYAPLAGLVLLTVWFGLFPQPLIALAQEAAAGLLNPQVYIESVFPAAEALPSGENAGEGAR